MKASWLLLFALPMLAQVGPVNPVRPPAPFPSVQNSNAGDSLCAAGKDATLFTDGILRTVTVTPGTDTTLPNSGTWTTTGGAGVGAAGTFTATAGNLATVTITSRGTGYTSNPTFVPSSGSIGTSATAFSSCANSADATSETVFATTTIIRAGTLAKTVLPVNAIFGLTSSAGSPPTLIIKMRLGSISGPIVYLASSNVSGASLTNHISGLYLKLSAPQAASAGSPVMAAISGQAFTGAMTNGVSTIGVSVATNAAQVIVFTATWGANTAGNNVWLYAISPY